MLLITWLYMVAFVVPKHMSSSDVVGGFPFKFCHTTTSLWDYNAKLKLK